MFISPQTMLFCGREKMGLIFFRNYFIKKAVMEKAVE